MNFKKEVISVFRNLVLEDGGLWAHFPWRDLPLKHGFSTVLAGNMALEFGEREAIENRERFFRLLKHPQEETVFINPQHRDEILFFKRYPTVFYPECDGVIIAASRVGIMLLSADCLPVILWGKIENHNFVGLVHAGRKGTELKITAKAIDLLVQRGVKAEDINIAIGPAIHACCYRDGKKRIDLIRKNIQQALDKGVSITNIIVVRECTCCAKGSDGKPIFFSHHRAKTHNEKEGRFIAFVAASEKEGS